MNNQLKTLFTERKIVNKIQNKLPKLFQIAELESSRAGKIGMEVGSLRERIIVALLIYKFGEKNVITNIPITESEVDVIVYNIPISIKTKTGKSFSGIKLVWTVDSESALKFRQNYKPNCDMIFVQINWNNGGGFYLIPKEAQTEVFKKLGIDEYIKLPKPGTNPRGVEMSAVALKELIEHKSTLIIPIEWKKETVEFDAFLRWIELWQQD
jgi:hypothetical protein